MVKSSNPGTGTTAEPRALTETESAAIENAELLADLGKKVIHVGGRPSTEQLFELARFEPDGHVLDAGCGVGSTAIEIASRFGCRVTAIDISPAMVESATANVRAAGVEDTVTVERDDILALEFPENTFDRVVVEAVVMFVDSDRAMKELVRVCKPGGYVVDHEAYLVEETPADVVEASQSLFPGIKFEAPEVWVERYRSAGLTDVEFVTEPVDVGGPAAMVRDEGLLGFAKIVGRLIVRPSHRRQMMRMMPIQQRLEPYLDYVVLSGRKPR